jgi:hypothetical protein
MRVRCARIGCEILAGAAQPVIYGVVIISSEIDKRRSAMDVGKAMRVELTDPVSSTRIEPEQPK